MTYDEVQDVWTITASLVQGALKFRADNAWNLDYGPENTDQLTGKLIRTTESISINEAGSYTITIDFSKSEEPYEYKYSVIKN